MINKSVQIDGVNHNSDEDDHDDNHETIHHFAWIKNLSTLVNSQLSKDKTKKFLCE